MSEQDQRDRFEAYILTRPWMKPKMLMRRDVEGTADHGEYAVIFVQEAWKDWQAAERAKGEA